jgi:hypothetical protein
VDTGLLGQGFLAETQGFPVVTDSFAKRERRWGDWLWHRANDIRPDCMCPERLCPMILRPARVPP